MAQVKRALKSPAKTKQKKAKKRTPKNIKKEDKLCMKFSSMPCQVCVNPLFQNQCPLFLLPCPCQRTYQPSSQDQIGRKMKALQRHISIPYNSSFKCCISSISFQSAYFLILIHVLDDILD